MQPRIYTYRITFEEIPYWYWGIHKEKRFGEKYFGSPESHAWMWRFYTPKIQILEVFPYTDEGWRKASTLEKRLILPDLNNPMCLNEHCGGALSLASCRKGGTNSHGEKNEDNKSVKALDWNKKMHEHKDNEGRSLKGLENGIRINEEKTETGKSLNAVKGGYAGGRKGGKSGSLATNSQNWMCLETGKVAPPGPLTNWQRKRGIDIKLRCRIT
jgi:hypothetical protein